MRVKTGGGFNANIERTLPAGNDIRVEESDVTDVRFSVIKAVNQANVAVTVDVLEPEHLRTIKLNLYREDQPGVAMQSIKMDNSPLVILPGRRYFLQLETSLGRHNYDYHTAELSFAANTSVQHLSLRFHPRRKSIESSETTQVSIRSVLVVLLLAGLAAYYHQMLVPLVCLAL